MTIADMVMAITDSRMTMNESLNPDFEHALGLDAPLGARLGAYASALAQGSPDIAVAYQELIDTLIEVDAGACAPRQGDRLQPFLLPDHDGRLVALDDALASGPLVVSFNRGSWCSFCALELSALNACGSAVREAGGAILSITPETATYSRRLRARLGLDYPVLSDIDNAYALQLGLAIAISPDVRRVLSDVGVDLGAYQKNDAWFVPIPATLIIHPDGTVQHAYVNPDFRQRLDPAELAALITSVRLGGGPD